MRIKNKVITLYFMLLAFSIHIHTYFKTTKYFLNKGGGGGQVVYTFTWLKLGRLNIENCI